MADNDALHIREILSKYAEDFSTSVWRVQGQSVIYHRALERIAAKAGIVFDPPVMLRCERDEAVILVTGRVCCAFHDDPETGETTIASPERFEWSIGEALVNANYRVSGKQAAYPYAMAEKRAKDRVILKLVGLHGLLYSEEEADAFKREVDHDDSPTAPIGISSGTGENRKSAYQARKDGRWTPLVDKLRACKSDEDLKRWTDDHTAEFEELPEAWLAELREEYGARAYEIKKGR